MGDRELRVDNDRPLRVEGNPDELHRMVLNLLDNAARHTPAGATIELRLRAEDGDAVVEVADDGPGIPAAMRDADLRPLRPRRGPRRHRRAAPAPASAWRSSAPSPTPTAARSRRRESDSGGALFRARIPLASSEQAVSDPLEAL